MEVTTTKFEEKPYAPRLEEMIGREEYLQEIKSALRDRSVLSYAFYFKGPGGIGKTRLLEEVNKLASDESVKSVGIIDFYHNDMRSVSDLRAKIAEKLDPTNEFFSKYREARN